MNPSEPGLAPWKPDPNHERLIGLRPPQIMIVCHPEPRPHWVWKLFNEAKKAAPEAELLTVATVEEAFEKSKDAPTILVMDEGNPLTVEKLLAAKEQLLREWPSPDLREFKAEKIPMETGYTGEPNTNWKEYEKTPYKRPYSKAKPHGWKWRQKAKRKAQRQARAKARR